MSAAEQLIVRGLEGPTLDVIRDHVGAHPDREVGGMLIGRIERDTSSAVVKAAIPALHAAEQRARLTFTHDTWEHVHRVLDRDHGGDTIVGWYHSHPGFGVFLSDHDRFIHQHFFADAAQVALVIDPVSRTEGAFGWRDGRIVSLFHRPVPSEPTTPASHEAP